VFVISKILAMWDVSSCKCFDVDYWFMAIGIYYPFNLYGYGRIYPGL